MNHLSAINFTILWKRLSSARHTTSNWIKPALLAAALIFVAASVHAGAKSTSDLSGEFAKTNLGKRMTAAGFYHESAPYPHIQTPFLKIFIVPDPGSAAINYQAGENLPWIVSGILRKTKEAKIKDLPDGYCFFWSELRFTPQSAEEESRKKDGLRKGAVR